jgi:hypothetical protein
VVLVLRYRPFAENDLVSLRQLAVAFVVKTSDITNALRRPLILADAIILDRGLLHQGPQRPAAMRVNTSTTKPAHTQLLHYRGQLRSNKTQSQHLARSGCPRLCIPPLQDGPLADRTHVALSSLRPGLLACLAKSRVSFQRVV